MERAIGFIAMATSEELKANAEYIRMADRCVEVTGGSNNNSYTDVDIVADIAEPSGVHSLWAGRTRLREPPGSHDSLATRNRFNWSFGNAGAFIRMPPSTSFLRSMSRLFRVKCAIQSCPPRPHLDRGK